MRSFIATATLLITAYSLHAEFAGFEFGSGIKITNGIAAVNFNADKGGRVSVVPGLPVGLVEIRVTFTNGTTKRTSLLYAGTHALKAPMTVEMVETLGAFSLLALLAGAIGFLVSTFRAKSRRTWRLPLSEEN
jgi:hypothetical protein